MHKGIHLSLLVGPGVPLPAPRPVMDALQSVQVPVQAIPGHEGTGLAYVQKLAKDVGYVFYVTPGPVPGTSTAYWGPETRLGAPQPALNIGMDAASNVESLAFSVSQTGAVLP